MTSPRPFIDRALELMAPETTEDQALLMVHGTKDENFEVPADPSEVIAALVAGSVYPEDVFADIMENGQEHGQINLSSFLFLNLNITFATWFETDMGTTFGYWLFPRYNQAFTFAVSGHHPNVRWRASGLLSRFIAPWARGLDMLLFQKSVDGASVPYRARARLIDALLDGWAQSSASAALVNMGLDKDVAGYASRQLPEVYVDSVMTRVGMQEAVKKHLAKHAASASWIVNRMADSVNDLVFPKKEDRFFDKIAAFFDAQAVYLLTFEKIEFLSVVALMNLQCRLVAEALQLPVPVNPLQAFMLEDEPRASNPASSALPASLVLCEATEYGVRFVTGEPVRFRFVRNTEKAPFFGATFGQDIEPAGRYLIHNPEPGDLLRGWEAGEVTFQKPLVLPLVLSPGDAIYGPTGWKAQLSQAFGGKTGKTLTCALRKLGYDGIVTCDGAHNTREIVDLSVVACPARGR